MELPEASLLAVDGNIAVVRVQGRKFPGVLLQGDTMKSLHNLLREAVQASDPAETVAVLEEAISDVGRFLAVYETALREAGIRRPYV